MVAPVLRHGMLADVRKVSRREVMGLGAILGLSACTGGEADSPTTPGSQTSSSSDPDAALATQVADQEWALVAAYDRALQSQPGLAEFLTPLRDQHRDHAASVGSTAPAEQAPSASGPVATREQVLADLLAAERAAVTERTQACEAASGASFASLVALIAASESGHVEYLRRSQV